MNKKKRFWLIGFAVVCIITIMVAAYLIAPEQNELPTLMDASGKIEVKPGEFDLASQPFIGDKDAPVSVIEFADFKCPPCKDWDTSVFPSIKQEFIDNGKVKFYFINFPFLGPDSIEAALAAETIFNQFPEKFWEFKGKLFENQGKKGTNWATRKFLVNLVKKEMKGIDRKRFNMDLRNTTYLFDVKKDFKIAAGNGIYGTPSFIVNGKKVEADQLRAEIMEVLH